MAFIGVTDGIDTTSPFGEMPESAQVGGAYVVD